MENIHWLDEVTQRKDDIINDLFRLLKINSVRNDELATEDAPVGPGPLEALEEFMHIAQEAGFETKQFGPWAGRVECGQGDELLGILGHVDVVPEGTGWDTDPFDPQIIDGKIFARGAIDDKGPTVAAYHAIKLLIDKGIDINKRIHLIIGTDEESEWQCMDHYFQEAEMPDFGFSPDGNFPIINGEKGNVSAVITQLNSEEIPGDLRLIKLQAGLRANMVPQDCFATIGVEEPKEFVEEFNKFLEAHTNLSGKAEIQDNQVEIHLIGKSAHGSTPEAGINAATHLGKFLYNYNFVRKDASHLIKVLGAELFEGFKGDKLDVDHHHEVMGDLSMNVGIVNYSEEEGIHININFRYPEGTNPETIYNRMSQRLTPYQFNIEMGESKAPHYVPADDPLVQTLLQVYENQTGERGYEKTIGGGTYGRLMPRGVAYGALFPDAVDTMHQANEFFAVDDLLRSTAIYAEAIYRLTR